jgi:hypothetical protein
MADEKMPHSPEMEDKKPGAQPADATGVMPPDNPKQEEKVSGVDVWAGNSTVEAAEMQGHPLSSQDLEDTMNDGLVNRRSMGTRYSELPPVNPLEGVPVKIYDVPIDADVPDKAVDWRDGDPRQ